MSNKHKIVRITKEEFELDNGKIYPHVIELDDLDKIPTIEEFQKIYDKVIEQYKDILDTNE